MGAAMEARVGTTELLDGSATRIVFFDVETNVPGRLCHTFELLEFGAVVLDARGLGELRSFHTLIRPADPSCIDRRTTNCNTITAAMVSDAPRFAEVADDIYGLMHGHIWAGHNILKFDILRISEAFLKIGKVVPKPSGVIDTYPLLRRTFGKRAGNYKLATLAKYCGYGIQEHRSIADVRLNIDVLRSCATMLFLESNYPDIFMTGVEVFTSTSVSEQSASSLANDIEEQEVSSEIRSPYCNEDSASATRQSGQLKHSILRVGNGKEILEELDSLRGSELVSGFKDLNLDSSNDTGEKSSVISGKLAYNCVHPKLSEGTSVLKTDFSSEVLQTGHEVAYTNLNAEKENDVESGQIFWNLLDDKVRMLPTEPVLNKRVADEDLSLAVASPTVGKESEDSKTVPTTISRADCSSTAKLYESCSARESGVAPFLLPSHVILSAIDLKHSGSSKTFSYNGVPLNLLEFKVRVHFTVNPTYAFSDVGRPRFSILIEPSAAACDVIRKCEELAKSMIPFNSEMKWLSGLNNDNSGRWTARMSIGTKLVGSCWTYTTEFFRSTSDGLEKMSLGPVDTSTFRNILPHGSIIDAGYGFYFFHFQNQAGVRLLAKHITFS